MTSTFNSRLQKVEKIFGGERTSFEDNGEIATVRVSFQDGSRLFYWRTASEILGIGHSDGEQAIKCVNVICKTL